MLSTSGPGGGGGVPSGKEGRGGALYYMNGITTAPGICPCVCEFSLTRLLIISRLFWRPLNPAPGDNSPPLPPPSLRHWGDPLTPPWAPEGRTRQIIIMRKKLLSSSKRRWPGAKLPIRSIIVNLTTPCYRTVKLLETWVNLKARLST